MTDKRRQKRAHNLWVRYRVTLAEFEALSAKNKGKCEICQEREGTCVDHCHDTNVVRGLICKKCNSAIALLGDTPEGVRNAFNYLKRHERRSAGHTGTRGGRIGNVRQIAIRRPVGKVVRDGRLPTAARSKGVGSVFHGRQIQQSAVRPDAQRSCPKHDHPGEAGGH